jgi:hypothetical protein
VKHFAILAAVSAFLTTGCAIETHSKGVQSGCGLFSDSNSRPLTVERVSGYYGGKSRKPDEVNKLDDGRTELVYYSILPGQSDSRHWSGYLVYLTIVPVLPLLLPNGHHGQSYLVSNNGLVVECTNFWHKTEGTPRIMN